MVGDGLYREWVFGYGLDMEGEFSQVGSGLKWVGMR